MSAWDVAVGVFLGKLLYDLGGVFLLVVIKALSNETDEEKK